jgi:membrane dipeptidase
MELLQRGWSNDEIKGLMGLNLLRVMDEVDRVKETLKTQSPSSAIYRHRTDLPAKWGGEEDAYLPHEVKEYIHRRITDEL